MVACLLALPATTVRAWFFGMVSSIELEFARILTPTDSRLRRLKLMDLCEAPLPAIAWRSRRAP